jgi:hypothetical protein
MYNRAHERSRQERETPERIMEIAKLKGSFSVSLRYRDEWLRRRCFKLRAAGLLRGGKRDGRELIFYPVQCP